MRLDVRKRVLPALANANVEAVVDEPHVRAHDSAQHDVADAIINRVLVRHPRFLHQPTLHAYLGRDRRDLARMV